MDCSFLNKTIVSNGPVRIARIPPARITVPVNICVLPCFPVFMVPSNAIPK